MRRGLLVVGHGSREASANAAFEACVAAMRQRHPEARVAGAFLEFARPSLDDGLAALAAHCVEVVVLPVFLFAAGHVERDIPAAVHRARRLHPQSVFSIAPCLRVHPALVGLACARIEAALPAQAQAAGTALVTVGRGASEPGAKADFRQVTRRIAAALPLASVQVSFIGLATPPLEDVLEEVASARPERVVVAPYFLFPGRLLTELHTRVAAFGAGHPSLPTHVAACLGPHPALFEALDSRLQETLRFHASSVTATKAAHPTNIAPGPLR